MYNIDDDGVLTDRDHNNQEWFVQGFSCMFHDGKIVITIEKARERWDVYCQYTSDISHPYLVAENITLQRALDRAKDYADRAMDDKNNVNPPP